MNINNLNVKRYTVNKSTRGRAAYVSKRNFRFHSFVRSYDWSMYFIGFLSASLFQTVYNYIKNLGEGFRFGSGMTFFGGLIGGVVCFLIG